MDDLLRGEQSAIWRAIFSLAVLLLFGGIAENTPMFNWIIWILGVALALGVWSVRPSSTPKKPEAKPLDKGSLTVLLCSSIIDICIGLSIAHTLFTHGLNPTGFVLGGIALLTWVVVHDLMLRHYYRLYCRKDVPYFTYTDLTMVNHAKRLVQWRR